MRIARKFILTSFTPDCSTRALLQLGNGFLRGQQPEPLLARHALLGELVVGGEARGVRGLRGAAVGRGFLRSGRGQGTRLARGGA